jgi:hypothetical protein
MPRDVNHPFSDLAGKTHMQIDEKAGLWVGFRCMILRKFSILVPILLGS